MRPLIKELVLKLKPYSVFSPPFEATSGGIRVMYGLYGWLLAKGQIVHLNARYAHSDFIAIYPEIETGNPAQANSVVRYILNKPGVMGSQRDGKFVSGPTSFADTDKIFVFSELFNTMGVDEEHKLFLPIIDTHLFRDMGLKRDKKAVFVGKGEDKRLHPQGCVLIDRMVAQDQAELAQLLNECEVIYQYDPVSAMSEIARLCGCRVVYLSDQYTREEYESYEPGINGISFGLEEDNKLDVDKFRSHYLGMKEMFSKKLDRFIELTQ